MELSDYLRIAKSRLWILILVPLIAGLGAAAFVLSRPQQYSAVAEIAAPALVGGANVNQYSGANGQKAYVANISAAIQSDAVLDKVAAKTHLSKSRIESGVSAAPIGESTIVDVTYQDTKKANARPVAGAVATTAMQFLFSTQLESAKATVATAQQQLTDAATALDRFTADTGLVVPDKDYETRLQQIANLQEEAAQQAAANNPLGAESIRASIPVLQGELNALAPKVAQYLSLVDAKTSAQTRLDQALASLAPVEAESAAADPGRTIIVGTTKQVPKVADAVLAAAAGIGAGLFLAAGIVALLEVWRKRKEPQLVVTEPPVFESTVSRV